jgi:hypothetical protein
VPLDGTYYLTADGTVEKPIVIKAAGDGPAIFDGNGNFALFDVKAADYTYFEGLTFPQHRHRDLVGYPVHRRVEGLTVRKCRFEDVGAGVFTNYSGSSNYYMLTTGSSAATIRITSSAGRRRRCGASSPASTVRSSRR